MTSWTYRLSRAKIVPLVAFACWSRDFSESLAKINAIASVHRRQSNPQHNNPQHTGKDARPSRSTYHTNWARIWRRSSINSIISVSVISVWLRQVPDQMHYGIRISGWSPWWTDSWRGDKVRCWYDWNRCGCRCIAVEVATSSTISGWTQYDCFLSLAGFKYLIVADDIQMNGDGGRDVRRKPIQCTCWSSPPSEATWGWVTTERRQPTGAVLLSTMSTLPPCLAPIVSASSVPAWRSVSECVSVPIVLAVCSFSRSLVDISWR